MLLQENIHDLVVQRVDFLRRSHPDLSISHFIEGSSSGEYGLILYTEYNFVPMGFEFIESRTSWERTEAITDYSELTEEGYCVLVFVPPDVLEKVAMTIRIRKGMENIRLFSADKLVPMMGS
jgi:hypothetical protein